MSNPRHVVTAPGCRCDACVDFARRQCQNVLRMIEQSILEEKRADAERRRWIISKAVGVWRV